MSDIVDYLGLTGVIALVAGIFGYGSLHERVKHIETCVEKNANNIVAIARLEEQVAAMRTDIHEIKRAVVK